MDYEHLYSNELVDDVVDHNDQIPYVLVVEVDVTDNVKKMTYTWVEEDLDLTYYEMMVVVDILYYVDLLYHHNDNHVVAFDDDDGDGDNVMMMVVVLYHVVMTNEVLHLPKLRLLHDDSDCQ